MEKQEIEKIKNQIEKAQKYLLSFSGNERKTYAIKQRIFKLKDKIGDTSPTYQLGPYGPFEARQESIMRPKIVNKYENMEEVVLFWPWGKLKSITYLRNGVPLDRVVYDENGEYKDFESMNPIENTNEK